jgi:hypothetical protein
MYRRRRQAREIPFSFDSFLDVVTNVVGIVIRLILVAWVGARSYQVIVPPAPQVAVLPEPAALPEPSDPRLDQIARRRRDLEREQEQALHRYAKQERAAHDDAGHLQEEIDHLVAQCRLLSGQEKELKTRVRQGTEQSRAVLLSLAELQKRSDRLLAEVDRLRKQPRAGKQLRYHTPVSAVVQTEEVMFECKAGHVTLLDTATLHRLALQDGLKQLSMQWEVSGVTSPVGAFRWRYVLERERSLMDGPGASAPAGGRYQASLSWQAEPVLPERGETAEKALSSGSDFRRLIDELDPLQTVVTLWVYPDSFPLYRALRDYLHGKEVVVAGRPLPDGMLIGSSRHGTASRGQ